MQTQRPNGGWGGMRFRTTWRATARRNERLRRSTFAGLRMARVLETVSRPCFNPLDPPFLGGYYGIGGHPQTLGSILLHLFCHSRGACPREDGERESRRRCRAGKAERNPPALSPFQPPGPNPLSPSFGKGVSRGNSERDTLGLPAGSVPASNAGLSSGTVWPCPGKRPRIRTVPRCLPRCHRSPSPLA